jgi:hypothetical protein
VAVTPAAAAAGSTIAACATAAGDPPPSSSVGGARGDCPGGAMAKSRRAASDRAGCRGPAVQGSVGLPRWRTWPDSAAAIAIAATAIAAAAVAVAAAAAAITAGEMAWTRARPALHDAAGHLPDRGGLVTERRRRGVVQGGLLAGAALLPRAHHYARPHQPALRVNKTNH